MLKIGIITNEFPTRSETFISNKVRELARRGNLVYVFCTEKNTTLYEELFDTSDNITIVLFSRKSLFWFFILHPSLWKLLLKTVNRKKKTLYGILRLKVINAFHPDIIHFEYSAIGISFLNELKFFTGCTVVSCRGSAEKVKLAAHEERKELTRSLFDLVSAIHCVSEDMRATILPYVKSPEKIVINYPSIETSRFKRKSPYSSQKILTLLSVGRLSFQKGYLIGLLVAKQLKSEGLIFRWLIIGEGKMREELMFHIYQMQLEEEIILLGAKSADEVKNYYEDSDIFFLPSVYEGIANAALEAMSMELPVVSTRSGGMEEVIIHQQNGLLADIYDSDTLAENIRLLSKDLSLRLKLGKAARNTILEGFELNNQINKFEKLYKGLIKSTL